MTAPPFTPSLLVFIGVIAAAPVTASAQSLLGPYVALGAGWDSMPDRNLDIAGRTVSSQWRPDVAGFAALGYRFSPSMRAEVELSGRDPEVKTFNGVNPWSGKQWDASVMVNGLYDFNLGGPVTPYVGAGLGASWVMWGDRFRATLQPPPQTIYDAEGTRAAWQGIVGVSYAVSPKIALALDARLKGSFGDYSFPSNVPGRQIDHFNNRTRSIFASVRYSFGAGQ